MEQIEEKNENIVEKSTKTSKLETLRSFFAIEDIEDIDNPKIEYIILFAILFVAFLLRIIGLGDLPLNEDEAYTLTLAKKMVTGETSDHTFSVYLFLQYIFFFVLGVSETVGRFSSAIFGTLSAYAMYSFCKKFINKKIAFLALILVSFSFFEVFMSRLAVPFALLQLLSILILWFLILFFRDEPKEEENNYLSKFFRFISIKHAILVSLLLLFALLFNFSALIVWVAAIFYCFLMFFACSKNQTTEKRIYLLTGIKCVVLTLLIWFLAGTDLSTGEKHSNGLMYYLKLISCDFNFLWLLGILGFCSSFFVIKNRKALFAIHSMMFSHLIMLGFFIPKLQQGYFLQAYSFYLIYPAIGIYTVYLLCLEHFKNKEYLTFNYKKIIFGLVAVLILFISIPFTFFENMFVLNMYSNVYINDKMTEYTFYPYREACKYIQENIEPDEEVVCIMPSVAEFYINRDIKSFRYVKQPTANAFSVEDEFAEDTTVYQNSLQNFPSFLNFIQTHKSGWIIIDPRIQTAVSAYTMDFIFAKMDPHVLGSNPIGLIFVMHWDNNTMFKEPQRFLFFCKENITEDIPVGGMNVPDSNTIIKITFIYSGVEKPDEALCVVGNEMGYLIPNREPGKGNIIASYLRAIEFTRTGNMSIYYNVDCGDPTGGFFIHDVIINIDE